MVPFLRQKRFRMIFRITKGDKVNYLSGTAHFFPYSFKKSLSRLISKVDVVLFEGPLNESDMIKIASYGCTSSSTDSLLDMLTEEARGMLVKEFETFDLGKHSEILRYMYVKMDKSFLEMEIRGLKPWMAFFKIWSFYLRKRGWVYSVDMEAHFLAKKLGKNIHYLETIEEQIKALEGMPVERIIDFLNLCSKWRDYAETHADFYLKGELDALLGATTSFPTRCESIIDKRDPILFERMIPFLEKGNVAIFVGVTHVKGISNRLETEGYSVSQLVQC
ncbi:MAG: TraB/GumN family protein [Deltaproteobacteria bacterium]|nr:TraB/GumN family protein [Deltaproteobacteria bacterium]